MSIYRNFFLYSYVLILIQFLGSFVILKSKRELCNTKFDDKFQISLPCSNSAVIGACTTPFYPLAFCSDFFDMLYYAFYPPYTISLIVLYEDFKHDMEVVRPTRNREWARILRAAVSLIVWAVVTDVILHFAYFNAMLLDVGVLNLVDQVQLVQI